jgi:predicted enzyme related to lactoylglutathione lyase
VSTIAVKNIDAAMKFYGRTLGLKKSEDFAIYESGNSTIVVYKSEFTGINNATSATAPFSTAPFRGFGRREKSGF